MKVLRDFPRKIYSTQLLLLFLPILITLLVSSCANNDWEIIEAVLQTVQAQSTSTPHPVEQVIVEVVITATPNAQEEPSGSFADTITPTSLPTPLPEACLETFGNLEIYGIGELKYSRLLITFTSESGFQEEGYELSVGDDSFTCSKIDKYPGRLYCVGAKLKERFDISLSLSPIGETCVLFQNTIDLPVEPTKESSGGTHPGSSYP